MIRKTIQRCFNVIGLEVRRKTQPTTPKAPPVEAALGTLGDVKRFLGDIRRRGFSPRGILDVGANKGAWTSMALDVFPGIPVIMIEPQDEMQHRLEVMCLDNKRLHYVKAGAGRASGELTQTIWADLAGSSFLPKEDGILLKENLQRRTQIVTIDQVLVENPEFHPDLVKLDIQGFEIEALSGGEALFGVTEVFIVETSLFRFLENMPLTREVIQFMAARQYEVYDVTSYLRRSRDGALGQIDLAFVKADGVFRQSQEWGS